MAIVEGCPAFQDGCPFANTDVTLLPTIMGSLSNTITEKCPAFKDGCPFKDMDSVEMLYNKLSEMPISHQVNRDHPAGKALGEQLRMMHTNSLALKSKFPSTCTVFATSCPFKTVTTYGTPLVEEMDLVVEQWGLQSTQSASSSSQLHNETMEPLSKSLKAGTKSVHRSAENVRFVRDFLKGGVPKESYVELLRALYHVYHGMEDALDQLPEHLKPCGYAAIKRAGALSSDLHYYLGIPEDQPLDAGKASPAAQQFVDRFHKLSKESPLLLLAHAYTRYLGDLSGGQILARSATKAYNLPEGKGVAFYNFERVGVAPAALKAFKNAYRAHLDSLDLSAPQVDTIVQEANLAFLMNILIFEERDVAAGHLQRIRTIDEISELIDTNKSPLEFQKAYGTPTTKTSEQCPFVPGPVGRRRPGDPSFHGGEKGVCPWPFVWLHDPKSAVISHPVKNAVGLLTMLGLARVAVQYPRHTFVGLLSTAMMASWLKPKRANDGKH